MNFTPYKPRSGDIGLSYGNTKFSRFVRFAQALIGDWAIYSHAFIYLGDGYIIESLTDGAKITRLDSIPPERVVFSQFRLSQEQRSQICEEARKLEGTKYSRLDFLAIGLTHFCDDCWLPRWVRRRALYSGKMICSQLVAESYRRAGIELEPGKDPQDFTPGDLARIMMLNFGRKYYT